MPLDPRIQAFFERVGVQLQAQSAPITISRYDGMVHGFMHLRNVMPLQQADQAFVEASHALRTAFAST